MFWFLVSLPPPSHPHPPPPLSCTSSFDFAYFTCVGVFPSCVSVHHMHAVLTEARRGHQIPCSCLQSGYGPFIWVLGIKTRSSKDQPVLLNAEPALLHHHSVSSYVF